MLELISRSNEHVLTGHLPLLADGETVVDLDLIASDEDVPVPGDAAAIVARLHQLTPSRTRTLTAAAARLRQGGRLIVLARASTADAHERAMLSAHTPLAERLLAMVAALPRPRMRESLRRHPRLDAWEGGCGTVAQTLFTLVDAGEHLEQADVARRSAATGDLPSMVALERALSRCVRDLGMHLVHASTYTSHEFLDRTSALFGVFATDGRHGYLPWTPADTAIFVFERS